MELAYQLWKKNQDVPNKKLFFFHALGGTGSMWRPIAVGLENDAQILAPDQRGHGASILSNKNTSYAPLAYGQDGVELIEKLNFSPCVGVGHSMGVRSALAAAILKPNYFSHLVLVDLGLEGLAGGGLGKNLSSFLKILPDGFSSRLEAKAFLSENCPDESIARYLIAVAKLKSDGSLYFPFDRNALVQTLEEVKDFTLRPWVEELAKKQVPMTFLRGEVTTVWSKADFERDQNTFSSYKHVRFVEVAGAGHGIPFERKNVFQNLLRDILRS